MKHPRYLCKTATTPVISYRDGNANNPDGYVRWKVTNANGATLAASEWVPDTIQGRKWVWEQMLRIEAKQREHGLHT